VVADSRGSKRRAQPLWVLGWILLGWTITRVVLWVPPAVEPQLGALLAKAEHSQPAASPKLAASPKPAAMAQKAPALQPQLAVVPRPAGKPRFHQNRQLAHTSLARPAMAAVVPVVAVARHARVAVALQEPPAAPRVQDEDQIGARGHVSFRAMGMPLPTTTATMLSPGDVPTRFTRLVLRNAWPGGGAWGGFVPPGHSMAAPERSAGLPVAASAGAFFATPVVEAQADDDAAGGPSAPDPGRPAFAAEGEQGGGDAGQGATGQGATGQVAIGQSGAAKYAGGAMAAASNAVGGQAMRPASHQLTTADAGPAPDTTSQAAPRQPRWSADSWMLWRPGSTSAPTAANPSALGPSYGASQVGAVLRYRMLPGSALMPSVYVRGYAALNGTLERESAVGVQLRPLGSVPVAVMGEMRASQFYDGTQHIRPAATLVTLLPPRALPGGFSADIYAQGGYVGGKAASPFADGQLRVDRKFLDLGRFDLRLGAGAWAGAQQNVARLDIGPALKLSLPGGIINGRGALHLAVDWRWRVAGNALPGSGVALTLAAGF